MTDQPHRAMRERHARFVPPGLATILSYRRSDLRHDVTAGLSVAAVAPLAAGDPQLYASLTIALTFIAGLLCIGASFLRLGALADFLSKPILVGYLAGIALTIVLGQIGKVTGVTIEAGGIAPRLLELVQKLPLIHWPTLGVGVGAFVVLVLAPRFSDGCPPRCSP